MTNEQLEHLTGENLAIVKRQRSFNATQLAAEETGLISLGSTMTQSIYASLVRAVYPAKLKAVYNFVT